MRIAVLLVCGLYLLFAGKALFDYFAGGMLSDLGLFFVTLPWSLPFDGDGKLAGLRIYHRALYAALSLLFIALNAALLYGLGAGLARLAQRG